MWLHNTRQKLFEPGNPPDKKTAKGRQPPNQDRKTTCNRNNTRKNKSDIRCDSVQTDKTNGENDRTFVNLSDSDFRRQTLVDFILLKNFEMHDG